MRRIWIQAVGVASVLATTAGFAGTPASNLRIASGVMALDLASLLGMPLGGLRPTHPAGGLVDCDAEPGIIIHDDGTVDSGYTGNPDTTTEVRFVDLFTPSVYPASFSAVCLAFVSLDPEVTSLDFEIVIFDDDGPEGAPGLELGSLTVTADGIPSAKDTPTWFSYDVSSLGIEVTEGSVFIGARWSPQTAGLVFIVADESAGNPPGFAGGYWWNDIDGVWVPTHDPDLGFENYRSLMVRAVERPILFEAASLEVDTVADAPDGNGVFEPGEQVDVVPGWRNVGSNVETLTGTASGFTGPGDATYTLVDDGAGYDEVDPDEIATCTDGADCYEMSVDVPAVRPAAHWDAAFDETLDDENDTTKTWTLHIGASFADVAATNVFYPAIETLLHSGITGGCAAGAEAADPSLRAGSRATMSLGPRARARPAGRGPDRKAGTDGRDGARTLQAGGAAYCPGGINSRAQMPVFMLRALMGPGYTPPDCVEGSDPFGDVPFDSLFCPWIQELANRGIVSGCGDGNYCPGNPVTRAQMAIFLLKTLEGDGYVPPECSNRFTDVPCPSLFADWIEELATRGITSGCTATEFCPGAAVTRAQMAVFITRAFGFTLYGP